MPCSYSAWMRTAGTPQSPKPPTAMLEPSAMSATASTADATVLSKLMPACLAARRKALAAATLCLPVASAPAASMPPGWRVVHRMRSVHRSGFSCYKLLVSVLIYLFRGGALMASGASSFVDSPGVAFRFFGSVLPVSSGSFPCGSRAFSNCRSRSAARPPAGSWLMSCLLLGIELISLGCRKCVDLARRVKPFGVTFRVTL